MTRTGRLVRIRDGLTYHTEALDELKARLTQAGSAAPRADALALMSLLEGPTLFVGESCRWAGDADAVREAVLALVRTRYASREPEQTSRDTGR